MRNSVVVVVSPLPFERTKACWSAWRARPAIKIIRSRAAIARPKPAKEPSAKMTELVELATAAEAAAKQAVLDAQPDPNAPPELPPRNEEEGAARSAAKAAKEAIVAAAAEAAAVAKAEVDKLIALELAEDEKEEAKLEPIYYPEEVELEYEDFDDTSPEAAVFKRAMVQDPNWVAVHSDVHKRDYYYHVLNRKTVWEKPKINVRCRIKRDAEEHPLPHGTLKRMTQYYTTLASSAKKEAKAEAAMSNRRCTTCGKLGHNKRTCFQRHDGDGLVPWGSGSEDDGEYQAPQRYDPTGRTRAIGRSSGRARNKGANTNMGDLEKSTTEGGKRIIQKILSARRGDRSQMCEYFLTLPERGELVDYYDIVDRPIAIAEIKKSLRNGDYVTIDDLKQDFSLMFDNARTYNEAGSFIIEDVLGLERVLREAMQEEEGLGMLMTKSSSGGGSASVQAVKVAETGKVIALKQKVDKDHCDVCTNDFTDPNKTAIMCDKCEDSFHLECLGMSRTPEFDWFCPRCLVSMEKRMQRYTEEEQERMRAIDRTNAFPYFTDKLLDSVDLSADPFFAEVCSFWLVFGPPLRLPELDQDGLEDALLRYSSKQRQYLTNIHVKLLRGIGHNFMEDLWEPQLLRFSRSAGLTIEAGLLKEHGYHRISPSIRLKIIRELMLVQPDENEKFRKWLVQEKDHFAGRPEPTAIDDDGAAYWVIPDKWAGLRAYKEVGYSGRHPILPPMTPPPPVKRRRGANQYTVAAMVRDAWIAEHDGDFDPNADPEVARAFALAAQGTGRRRGRRKRKDVGDGAGDGDDDDGLAELDAEAIKDFLPIDGYTVAVGVAPGERPAPNMPKVLNLYQQIKAALRTLKGAKSDGKLVANVFAELPDRQNYPQYYEFIKQPISLMEISGKHQAKMYASLDAFEVDIKLMLDNAKFFNEEGSQIHQDALALEKASAAKFYLLRNPRPKGGDPEKKRRNKGVGRGNGRRKKKLDEDGEPLLDEEGNFIYEPKPEPKPKKQKRDKGEGGDAADPTGEKQPKKKMKIVIKGFGGSPKEKAAFTAVTKGATAAAGTDEMTAGVVKVEGEGDAAAAAAAEMPPSAVAAMANAAFAAASAIAAPAAAAVAAGGKIDGRTKAGRALAAAAAARALAAAAQQAVIAEANNSTPVVAQDAFMADANIPAPAAALAAGGGGGEAETETVSMLTDTATPLRPERTESGASASPAGCAAAAVVASAGAVAVPSAGAGAAVGSGPPALPPRMKEPPAYVHVPTPAELAKQKADQIKATAARLKSEAIARIAARKAAEDAEDDEEEEDNTPAAPAYEVSLKILQQLSEAKSAEGVCFADTFKSLPMRHSSKGKKYFKQVAKPISFRDMFARCRKRYNTIAHLRLDFERLVDNTKKFYRWNEIEVKHITELQTRFYPLFLEAMAANEQTLGYYRFPAEEEYVEEVSVEVTTELNTLLPLLAEPNYDPYEPGGRPYGPVALAEESGRQGKLAEALTISSRSEEDWTCFAKSQKEYETWLTANEAAKPTLVAILRAAIGDMSESDEVQVEDPIEGGAMPGSAARSVNPYHYPGTNTLTNVGGTFSSAY